MTNKTEPPPPFPSAETDAYDRVLRLSVGQLHRALDESLTVILGFAELILLDERLVKERANLIIHAAEKANLYAQELTRRLELRDRESRRLR